MPHSRTLAPTTRGDLPQAAAVRPTDRPARYCHPASRRAERGRVKGRAWSDWPAASRQNKTPRRSAALKPYDGDCEQLSAPLSSRASRRRTRGHRQRNGIGRIVSMFRSPSRRCYVLACIAVRACAHARDNVTHHRRTCKKKDEACLLPARAQNIKTLVNQLPRYRPFSILV
jgi:hypothetical protein